MGKRRREESRRVSSASGICCCKVESVITIDDRGQMVLPKELRERAKILPGDKLAVVNWEKDGETCCISLIKVDNLAGMVKDMLGPLMRELFWETKGGV